MSPGEGQGHLRVLKGASLRSDISAEPWVMWFSGGRGVQARGVARASVLEWVQISHYREGRCSWSLVSYGGRSS